MFWRKSFVADKERLLQDDEDKEQRRVFQKFCSVSEETEATKQQNQTLNLRLDELRSELASGQDLQNKYKELKAERKRVSDLNKYLEKQVRKFQIQLQDQMALEEKLKSVEEERQQVVQNNKILEQQILEINLKLKDREALEEEYKVVKAENKTLTQQNNVLQQEVQDLQQKIYMQNHLEKKCMGKTEENHILEQHNFYLQTQVQVLTRNLKDQERMMAEYKTLKAEKKAKMDHNYNVQNKIQDLKEELKVTKPWLNKNHDIRDQLDVDQKKKSDLTLDFQYLHNKFRPPNAWNSKRGYKTLVSDDNMPELEHFESGEGSHEAVEAEKKEQSVGTTKLETRTPTFLPPGQMGFSNNLTWAGADEGGAGPQPDQPSASFTLLN